MSNQIRTVTIAYFSGTGGTKAAADCMRELFQQNESKVNTIAITSKSTNEVGATDLLVVLSPVYAFRLASIVEKWIKKLPKTNPTKAAIISVSGGGEVSPNTACRVKGKQILNQKGYHVVYENMLVMPSNFATIAEDTINYRLIQILPSKIEQMVKQLLAGEGHITTPQYKDRIIASLGKGEHVGARIMGASMSVSSDCNQCSLCIRNCPTKNISMKQGNLSFGFSCIMCMKCIYACPKKALLPRIGKSSVLEGGYNLKELTKTAKNKGEVEYRKDQNTLWEGVIKYLEE